MVCLCWSPLSEPRLTAQEPDNPSDTTKASIFGQAKNKIGGLLSKDKSATQDSTAKEDGTLKKTFDQTINKLGSIMDKTGLSATKTAQLDTGDTTAQVKAPETEAGDLDSQQRQLKALVERQKDLKEEVEQEYQAAVGRVIDASPQGEFEGPDEYQERLADNERTRIALRQKYERVLQERRTSIERKIEGIVTQTYRSPIKLEIGSYIAARERFTFSVPTTGQRGSFVIPREIAKQFKTDFNTLNPIGVFQLQKDGTRRLVNVEIKYNETSSSSLVDRDVQKVAARQQIEGHKRTINVLAFNNLGTLLATGGDDKTVKIWDANKHTLLSKLDDFDSYVTALNFHPNQQILACGDYDGNLQIYNVDTQSKRHTVKAHDDEVKTVSFNFDGSELASGGRDGLVKIWDTQELKLKDTLDVANQSVISVIYSPDGNKLLVGLEDGTVKLFDPFKHTLKQSIDSKSAFLTFMAISPDGQTLATSGIYKEIRLWNTQDLSALLTIKDGINSAANRLAFSYPDGYILAGSTEDDELLLWDTYDGALVKKIEKAHENKIKGLDFNVNGKMLASCSADKTLRLWNVSYDEFSEFASAGRDISGGIKSSGLPPNLNSQLTFYEPSGNNILDALEEGQLTVTIENSGEGDAHKVMVLLSGDYPSYLNFRKQVNVGPIPAGGKETVEIPLQAGYRIPSDQVSLTCTVKDQAVDVQSEPIQVNFETAQYYVDLALAGRQIIDNNQDARISPRELVTVQIYIQNRGSSLARAVKARVNIGENVFFSDTPDQKSKFFDLGDLAPGEHKEEVVFDLWANSSAPDTLPVYLSLNELWGEWGNENIPVVLPFDKPNITMKTLTVEGHKQAGELTIRDFSIDVEENIPQTLKRREKALAVVFGIEKYKDVSDVSYAKRDAAFVKQYFQDVLGIPEIRIYFKTDSDVGKAEFDKVFSPGGWLDKRLEPGVSEIYVYYSGHGAPDLQNNQAFLIPYDGDPNYASQTGYALDRLYESLAGLQAKNTLVFLDACFSGADRESDMLLADARPVFIEAIKPDMPENVTVYSAASAKQISSAWPEKRHGLFTYYLLKGLQGTADTNQDGQLTNQELFDFIKDNVNNTAGMLDREQMPQLQTQNPQAVITTYESTTEE